MPTYHGLRVDHHGLGVLFFVPVVMLAGPTVAAGNTAEPLEWSQPGDVRDVPPIFVSIVSHNEEPPGYPDFMTDEPAFWLHRAAVVAFAQMLTEEGVAYNYQSDWNFLAAAVLYDHGTPETNGKNLVRYLREDLGFEVDPHAHETRYNYADVARYIDLLGVPPSHTVGGYVAYPPEESKLEYLWQPITSTLDPGYVWQAQILWGGATRGHIQEEHLWISGIWRPRDDEHFLEHDPSAPLPDVGGYRSRWEGLRDLIVKQQRGELEEGKIYTQTIFTEQSPLLNPGYIDAFRANIEALEAYTQAGSLVWVGLEEVIGIWETVYGCAANLYPYAALPESVYYQPALVHDVDILPGDRLLVTDGGGLPLREESGVYEIDREGLVHWSYTTGLNWAHNADRLPGGDVIISDSGNDRVLLVNEAGEILWNTDEITLSDGSVLQYPDDAHLLSPSEHRLITDRDNHRVIEVDSAGTVFWQFGVTGEPGGDFAHLRDPHHADRLGNGHTIIADANNDRILEVDAGGLVVWIHEGDLDWPRDADRLPTGRTLITDSRNDRVVEVDSGHNVIWSYDVGLRLPFDADRLPSGNTLISNGSEILEVDPTGSVIWRYEGHPTYREVWIRNPTSGVDLYCHVHYPSDFVATDVYPGLVLIPGGNGAGTMFDDNDHAQGYADSGLIVMHFDPDGRGLSTNGGTYTVEDYDGLLQQDGLREVFQYLVDLTETDDQNCGMFSYSYGVTMASGMLARYPQNPLGRFLMDFEGPHNRSLTAVINGGHVLHDTSDVIFWSEREADRFMPDIICRYLRIQSEHDHNAHAVGNPHAIALTNAATHILVGGRGQSPWTRVNDETLNLPNQTYSSSEPPTWLPDAEDTFAYRVALLLEMVGPQWSAVPAVDLPRVLRTHLRVSPNPLGSSAVIRLDLAGSAAVDLTVCDVLGRCLRRLYRGHLDLGTHLIAWDGCDAAGHQLPSGVYHVRAAPTRTEPTCTRILIVR